MKNFFRDKESKMTTESGTEVLQPSFRSRSKFRLNLRVKLPLVVFSLLILSFVGITALSVNVSRSTLTETLKEDLATKGSLQAENVRSRLIWTRSMAIDLSTVAESVILDAETSKKTIAQMLSQNEQVVGSTIAYEPNQFDPTMLYWAPYYSRASDGSLQYAQLGTSEYNYPQQDWYKLAKEANGIILSPPYFDEGGGNIWMVTWSVPFHDQLGNFRGVATADIAFSQTQEIVQQIEVGEHGYAFLVDLNGVILGMGDQGGQYEIMKDRLLISAPSDEMIAWNNMISGMTQGNSGFTEVIDPAGNAMFVSYHPIGMNTGWSLGLAYPQEELFHPAVSLQTTLVSLSLIVLAIASVILFFFSQTITRPIQKITSWARLMSQKSTEMGSNWVLPPLQIHTNDEIEELSEAFNLMSTELAETFATLEQRVADRTRALANVAEISTVASNIQNEDEMLATVVHLVQRRFGLYHAHVFTYHEDQEELQIVACGYKEGDEHEGTHGTAVIPLSQEQSLVARAGRSQKPVIVNDVRSDPGWLPNPLLPDTAAELAVPLLIGDKLIGVLDVQSDKVNTFTESDADIQMTLGAQIAVASQNIRQYENTRKIASDMGVVAAVSIATSTITETGRLLQDMVDLSKKSFGLYHVHIYLFNEAGNALNLTAGADEVGRQMVAEKRSIPLDSEQSLVARAARTGEGVVVNDVTLSQDFLPNPLLPETRAELAVPMMVGGKVIGVLDVQSETVGRFTQVDVNIQTTLASQVAVALQNARSFAQAQRQAEREAELNLMTQRIQGTTSIEAALQIAAREIGHALGMKPTLVSLAPSALTSNQTDDTQLSQN